MQPLLPVTVAAATAAAATSGVYLAFTAMVLPALDRRAPGEAVATMRAINRAAVRAPFMTLFFGGALAAAVAGALSLGHGSRIGAVGAALTLGSHVVTVASNVPLNNALERDDPLPWSDYSRRWGRANGLRAALSAAGAACLAAGLAAQP